MAHYFRPPLIVILLASALLGSLVGNIVLYRANYQSFKTINAVRLDPLNLAKYADQPGWLDPNSPQLKAVWYGDSRALQWSFPPGGERFQFLNRGISYQTSAQVLLRYAVDIEPLQPDLIVLQVGINDLKTIALFPQDSTAIIANCQRNLQAIVAKAQQAEVTVVLTTIFPPGDQPRLHRLIGSTAVDQAIEEVNTLIRSLAGADVIVFDSAALLADARGKVQPAYQFDHLHINAAGYALLNQELLLLLNTLNF